MNKEITHRIPQLGAVRYYAQSHGTGLHVECGVVDKIAQSNAPIRRGYTGIIAPPPLIRKPHARIKNKHGATCWVPVDKLSFSKKVILSIVDHANRMYAQAQRMSPVDPLN